MNRRDFFPLPACVKVRTGGMKGGRSRKRRRIRILKHEVLCNMTFALNRLADGKIGTMDDFHRQHVSEVGGGEKIRNSAQDVARKFLEEIADSAVRRNYFALDATSDGLFDYTDDIRSHRVWLEPEMVSLPKSGAAGTTQFLDLLSADLREIYENENSKLVLEKPFPSPVPRFFLGVSTNKYHALILKLVDIGVVLLQNHRPRVINGVFAVPKDENKQRLIIDARPANAFLIEPEKTKLPNPGDLGALYLDKSKELYFCKSDMDNFYHRLAMPPWLHQFFGLPPVMFKRKQYWPVVRVLPMGWSHSVFVGQSIHERIVSLAGMKGEDSFQENQSRVLHNFRHGEYIYDFFAFCVDKECLTNVLEQVVDSCEKANLPSKVTKIVRPGESDVINILGITFSHSGLVQPNAEKLAKLINVTREIASFRVWNVKLIEKLIGSWTWIILLRRPIFSILFSIYSFVNTNGSNRVKVPSQTMRRELRTLCDISPLILANIKRPFGGICVASDASETGAGVVYSSLTIKEWEEIEKGESQTAEIVASKSWKTAIRHKWEYLDQIHILEGHAVVLGLKWILRSKRFQGSRIVFLVDNTALLGALKKGRSSSFQLTITFRKVATLCIAGDLRVNFYYTSTQSS